MSKNVIIEVRDVHFNYPDGTPAIKGISLDICEGEFVALLGQNGAGKTTFAKTLNGLLKPYQGYVKVGGIDTNQKSVIKKLVEQVGYVFQNPDHQSSEDHLAFGVMQNTPPIRTLRFSFFVLW